jgi:glycerate 2-kinase
MMLREHAQRIWTAAALAVRPGPLLRAAVAAHADLLRSASRIVVLGGGKAGTAMALALEEALDDLLGERRGLSPPDRFDPLAPTSSEGINPSARPYDGWLNVPAGTEKPTRRIHLHPARPPYTNFPTEEGVFGSRQILKLAREAGPDDVAVCLLSGGGSALLPAPCEGIPLADKRRVTELLHASGASIDEMNAVRKHLSDIKGGRLAQAFAGRRILTLILSDVVGDPLDVIASGPTVPDPTTFAESLAILQRRCTIALVPKSVLDHLERGIAGQIAETPKEPMANVDNVILGNNARALAAAEQTARALGYQVLNLGSFLEGETRHVASTLAGITRSIRADGIPVRTPACILSGGETTVRLAADHGRGGRNQEFVLASIEALGSAGMRDLVVLSGGTDGEDGPTPAAGAIADAGTIARAASLSLDIERHLARNDAYEFFRATGDLLVTGPTDTNVMDVRVTLIG